MTNNQDAAVVPTDHTGLKVLSLDECLSRLGQSPVGRVAFELDGEITVLPVNHTLDGVDVCFRTLGDSKIEAAVDHARVSFQVDSYDESTRDGWSVLVQGTAVIVDGADDVRRLESVARKPWIPGDLSAMTWIRVRSQNITGRAIVR
jgi:nitroimidazol reductase NimA-like FMN-containing flavoprotein (pyridoxamine 5'-phosphate oxidase superfamily)